ncbi:hypothetical protein DENSPDRAFT_843972, partial [Dentipellis sp. KUC8613]
MDRNPSDDEVLRSAKNVVHGLKEANGELKQSKRILQSELQMASADSEGLRRALGNAKRSKESALRSLGEMSS